MTEIFVTLLSFCIVAWIALRAVARDPALRREVSAWAGQLSRPRGSEQRGGVE